MNTSAVRRYRGLGLLLAASLGHFACGKNADAPAAGTPTTFSSGRQESGPPKPTLATAPATPSAAELWASTCVSCHGEDGKGQGYAAQASSVRPPDFTSAAWQAAQTDQQIGDAIVKGGAGVGKSPAMPAQAWLAKDPATLAQLVAKVRSYRE